MIEVEHRTWEHRSGSRKYDSAQIDVRVEDGTVRVSASRYGDGKKHVHITLLGPRGGYHAALVFEEDQAYPLRREIQRAAEGRGPRGLSSLWGDFIVEPVFGEKGLYAVGYMGARGKMRTLRAGVDGLWDIAAAVRFCVAEAWS